MTEEHKRGSVDIDELLSRGMGEVVDPDGRFRKKLLQKQRGEYDKEIIVKFGVDPTRPDIHLGHAVVFRKLRKLQDLGCKVVFLVGDFTARIGDPTGRDKIRPELEQHEIEENMKTYLAHVDKILRVERDAAGMPQETPLFSFMTNGEWFFGASDFTPPPHIESLTFTTQTKNGTGQATTVTSDSFLGKAVYYEATRMQKKVPHNAGRLHTVTVRGLLATLRTVTHAQLIERDMFQERIRKGTELYMHEMLYPVLQGIDSTLIANIYGSCDAEIGGTDQTFNMLMGRSVMRANNQEEQAVLSVGLLPGLDGKSKMSKSLDNYIALHDSPENMFGKVMSLPDAALKVYFELCTVSPLEEAERIMKDIEAGKMNPRDAKRRLAHEIVALYHGEEQAARADEGFTRTFSHKEMPDDAPVLTVKKGSGLEVLLPAAASSKAHLWRLRDQGAISVVGGEVIRNPDFTFEEDTDLRIGKHRFLKVVIG